MFGKKKESGIPVDIMKELKGLRLITLAELK